MEHFQTIAFNSWHLKPKFWFWFVHDTFVIWKYGGPAFHSHFNNIAPYIQFTMEIEFDNSLPFLDVLVSRHPNGSLSHQVYRKNNHTNRYLHALSHHHPSQKSSVLKTLIYIALRIFFPQFLSAKKSHLVKVFKANYYSSNSIAHPVSSNSNPSFQIWPLLLHDPTISNHKIIHTKICFLYPFHFK